jgi:hypothetical protein
MGENFVSEDGKLTETREASRVIAIAFCDRVMVFEESTVGITRSNLHRLAALDFKTPPALETWMYSLPLASEAPVVFTDTLQALAFEMGHTKLEVPDGAPAALVDAVTALPLSHFARRKVRGGEAGVSVMPPAKELQTVTSPAAIKALSSPKEFP